MRNLSLENLKIFDWIKWRSLFRNLSQPKILISCLILGNLSITLPLATILNIWIDEAYSLDTTGKNFAYALHQALYFELQAPLYFILLYLWRQINDSIFFARLFSIICIVLVILAANALGKRFLSNLHAGWFTAAIAFNPFTIWAALEIRLYALAILLSTLLLICFFDGYLTKKPKQKARFYYIVLSILALYTQYYLGFMLVANACALMILKRWRYWRDYILKMVIVGFCFVPIILVIPSQVSGYTENLTDTSSMLSSFVAVFKRFMYYVLPTAGLFELRKWIFSVFGFFIFLLAMKAGCFKNIKIKSLIAILTGLSLTIILFMHIIGASLVEFRHTAVLFVPIMLFVSLLLEVIYTQKSLPTSKLSIVWIFVVIFFYLNTLTGDYMSLAKRGDWHRVASYIMATEKVNQPILVFTPESILPLKYYYYGINSLNSIPETQKLQNYQEDLQSFVINSADEISTSISLASAKGKDIWLVTDQVENDTCRHLGISYNCQILAEFALENYDVVTDNSFYFSRVRLLHPKTSLKTSMQFPK